MEILITILLVGAAGYFIFNNIKKKTSGQCDCGSCTSKCPKYEEKS